MAKWNQLVITDAGYQLSAKTLAGTKIQYTHAQTTDKDMSALTSDELKSVTKLDSVVQDLSVGIITVQDDHTVNIPVKVSNQDVTADYLLCGLAIFAKPVDGDEVLYGIATAVSPDLMVAQNGSTVVGTNFKLKVHVGSAANVNIVISPDGSVSNEELEGILKSYVLTSDLAKQLPADTPGTSKNETVTGTWKYSTDPVDKNGKPYITDDALVNFQAPKITASKGDVKTSVASGADLSLALLALPRGLTSIYVSATAINNPSGTAMHGLVQMFSASGTAAKGTFIDSNGNVWSTVVNGTTVTYTQLVGDNGDGTLTLAGRKFIPADEDHVVQVNEAGNGSKVNFDSGDLTVDGADAIGMVMAYSDDDADAVNAYATTHEDTLVVHRDSTRPAGKKNPFSVDTGGTA